MDGVHLASLVEMVESGFDERVLLGDRAEPVTGARLGQLVLTDPSTALPIEGDTPVVVFDDWLATFPAQPAMVEPASNDDAVAVVLFTSGTTSEPKASLLAPSPPDGVPPRHGRVRRRQ
jgi:acyl-coenzyme A synthetase/AMP-(fatty) acid ligase